MSFDSFEKWQKEKEEKADQITDGAIIASAIVASGGTSIPVALSLATGGGAMKVIGKNALIGDSYNKVEQMTGDFASGTIDTV